MNTLLKDCRSGYGDAVLELCSKDKHVIGITADLAESVKLQAIKEQYASQFIDCGICEQHMVSMSGAMSLMGYIPFVSTFGAFMTSRARDQIRVNTINNVNVKYVSTHCGLSVGEDGPTHQAIDDMSSMMSMHHMRVVEPLDYNHTKTLIHWMYSEYGSIYMRMGREKLPVLELDNEYYYGKTYVFKEGSKGVIIALGGMIHQVLPILHMLDMTIIGASSPICFDDTLYKAIGQKKHIITLEDHNPTVGMASQIALQCSLRGIRIESMKALGVYDYQLSGKPQELYKNAFMDSNAVLEAYKMIG